jgi:hypothetical protein
MEFMRLVGRADADQDQKVLNKEIRGEDTSRDRPVPPAVRRNLEHVADPDEHPPV